MAGERGALMAQITVPSGGWGGTATGTSSAAFSIAAGTYYMSASYQGGGSATDFLAALDTALTTATGDVITVSLDIGEGSSFDGKITITSDANLSIAWTDTELRDLLGYTADLSPSMTHVATNAAKGVWLPDTPHVTNAGPQVPSYETDGRSAESPSGDVFAFVGTRKSIFAIAWNAVSRDKALERGLQSDTADGDSFEEFWNDAIIARASGFTVSGPIIWFPDADDLSAGVEGYVVGEALQGLDVIRTKIREDYTGYWRIELPRFVVADTSV